MCTFVFDAIGALDNYGERHGRHAGACNVAQQRSDEDRFATTLLGRVNAELVGRAFPGSP
jgi:hypothetical protein